MIEEEETTEPAEVRVYKPKAVFLGFYGVIAPLDWEDKYLVPFVRQNLLQYLTQNWNNESLEEEVRRLRQESMDQHFVYGLQECPVIIAEDDDQTEQIKSVNDFINWLLDHNRDNVCQNVLKMVMNWGLDNKKIKIKIFSDVLSELKRFRNIKLKIALSSASVEEQLCRQFLSNTTEGDLNPYFDRIFDKTTGDLKSVETFKKVAKELSVSEKDILYVTDNGPNAKCADQLSIQCLLIVRPMNRMLRKYYKIRFSLITELTQIKFVDRPTNT